MSELTKPCERCGKTMTKRPRDAFAYWEGRRFCSQTCRARSQKVKGFHVRLWEKIDVGADAECWPWTGCLSKAGYGQIGPSRLDKRRGFAHRLAWESVNGPIPDGLYACHKCDNPRCCNPSHLFLGTQKQNMEDMARKGRGTRGRGGKLTEADVLAIRADQRLQKDIAAEYGISQAAVSDIKSRTNWAWLRDITEATP